MQEEQAMLMTGGGTLGAIGAVNTPNVLVYLTSILDTHAF